MAKRIVIFGATGNTGLCVLNHAVKKGMNVRVFVRDTTKIPEDIKDKVDAVVGDVTNINDVSKALIDRDAVIVALGTRNDLRPTTVLSQGMRNIIEAMKMHNVELVSVCLSAFLFYKPDAVPLIFRDLNVEHQRMLDILKESGLKWIAILPPNIADVPSSEYIIKHDEFPGRVISKYDLGAFLVDCLEQSDHYQQICGIASSLYLFY